MPFGLWKGQISLIWTFWNSFLEIKWFGLFLAFFNLEENSIFFSLFWLNFNKSYNTLWYFKNFLIYFSKFSLKIWPLFGLFHHLRIWNFLKLLMAEFGLFCFWDLVTLFNIPVRVFGSRKGDPPPKQSNKLKLRLNQAYRNFGREDRLCL